MLLVIGDILLIYSQASSNMSEIALCDWTLWQWQTFSNWLFLPSSTVSVFNCYNFCFLSRCDQNVYLTFSRETGNKSDHRNSLQSPWTLFCPRVLRACFVLSLLFCFTNTHKHRCKQKKNVVLFSLKGRDLETAALNGRKTMKHSSSSSEEALPGSRSMTLLPPPFYLPPHTAQAEPGALKHVYMSVWVCVCVWLYLWRLQQKVQHMKHIIKIQ